MPIYPTFDPGLPLGTNVVLTNGNLTATCNGTANQGATSSNGVKVSGKHYMEWLNLTDGAADGIGVRNCSSTYAGIAAASLTPAGSAAILYSNGNFFLFNNMIATGIGWINPGTMGMALDVAGKKIWYTNNGVTWTGGGDPAAGTGGLDIEEICPGEGLYPCWIGTGPAGSTATANFGAAVFVFTPPSGFTAWDSTTDYGSAHIDVGSTDGNIFTVSTTPTISMASNGGVRKALVMVGIEKDGGAPAVTSISGASLAFSTVGSAFTYTDGVRNGRIEVWEAIVGSSFSAATITATIASTPDASWMCGMVINNYTSYDNNSPWTGSSVGTNPSVNITTIRPQGIFIGGVGSIRSALTGGPQFDNNLSQIVQLFSSAATNDYWGNVAARAFTSVVINSSFGFGTQGSMLWGEVVVGVGGLSPPAPPLSVALMAPAQTTIVGRKMRVIGY